METVRMISGVYFYAIMSVPTAMVSAVYVSS